MRRDSGETDERFAAYVRDRGDHHLRVAVLLTGDWHAAEDLVQTSLVKLYRAWPRLDTGTSPDAYLRRIMINTHRSWWRALSRREAPTAVLPEDSTTDDIAERQAISAVVRQALAGLPRQQRAVLVLRYAADLPEAEVAGVLGCSPGTVKTHAHRGLRALRDLLGDSLGGDFVLQPANQPAGQPANRPTGQPTGRSTSRGLRGVRSSEPAVKEHEMNDTEDAVRRLFTVAVQDIPPGVDLGHDVLAASRTRAVRARAVRARAVRARAVRARVVLSAGLAAIVAAATVITLSAVRAPSALAQVTQAATRTAGQSYRVTSTRTLVRAPGASTADGNPVTITGEFDPARSVGEETVDGRTQIRYVGDYIYLPVFGAFRRTHPWALPKSSSWVKLHVTSRSSTAITAAGVVSLGGIAGVEPFNPQDLLSLLESADHVREAGAASGPGWKGSAYTFTVTVRIPGQPHQVLSLSGTVDVDQQGRVRRLDVVESVEKTVIKVQMTFGDFGIGVSVSAPPADETVSP